MVWIHSNAGLVKARLRHHIHLTPEAQPSANLACEPLCERPLRLDIAAWTEMLDRLPTSHFGHVSGVGTRQ
ncbi:MAG: hypothetical protein EBS89_12150 [Proteobacteria bacterium]|nr:hypothetical protein [Pseudomonadota bacterium]